MELEMILNYLRQLESHNDRDWFHAHKKEYQEACAAFEELLGELIAEIGAFDSSVLHNTPKELTFKLMRDTRFSHDKSPYLPAFRAHISSRGKLPVPVGYYLMIKPGDQSFLGGGLFADMFKNAPEFQRLFTVRGTALKNVPKEYDQEHPQAEFLKFKSWYLEYILKDEELRGTKQFIHRAAGVFEAMKPFNDYLNLALTNFEMPRR